MTVSPLQGLEISKNVAQGCADFVSLALGYYLSGLRPLRMEFELTEQ
jgi:hypothetical protein